MMHDASLPLIEQRVTTLVLVESSLGAQGVSAKMAYCPWNASARFENADCVAAASLKKSNRLSDRQTRHVWVLAISHTFFFFFFFLAHAILHFAPHRSMLHACASSVGTAWVWYFSPCTGSSTCIRPHARAACSVAGIWPHAVILTPSSSSASKSTLSFTHRPEAFLVHPA